VVNHLHNSVECPKTHSPALSREFFGYWDQVDYATFRESALLYGRVGVKPLCSSFDCRGVRQVASELRPQPQTTVFSTPRASCSKDIVRTCGADNLSTKLSCGNCFAANSQNLRLLRKFKIGGENNSFYLAAALNESTDLSLE
jgi:hypothetical protein